MKRLLVLIILFIFVPFMVLADAAGPYIIEYDAIIVNKNGIKYKDDNGVEKKIPYNSKVRVTWEYEDELSISYIDKNNNEISLSISKKDIVPYDEEINPYTYKESDGGQGILTKENSSIIIFAKNGIKLRKGPSSMWKEYDETIEYMTILSTTYTMYGGSGPDGPENLWFYVENNRYHGWIDSSQIAYKVNNNVLTFANLKMKDENGNEILTIPAETVLDEMYNYESKKLYYVKYNFEQGFIGYDALGYEISDYVLSKNNIKLTSMSGDVRATIPFGERLEVLYADYIGWNFMELEAPKGYFYVKYKNQNGYVKAKDVFIDNYSELDSKFISQSFMLINDVTLYELESKKEIATISHDTKVSSPYCYVEYYDKDEIYYQDEWCIIKDGNNIGRILTKRIRNDEIEINNTNQKDTEHKMREVRLENIYIEGYYDIGFNKRERQYTVKIKNEDKLNINVLKEIDTDEVEIIGNENLKNGSIIRIIVTRGKDSTKYFINIEKDSLLKAKQVIIYCVIGALALGIMSFGVILLVNKKRKDKKNVVNANNIDNSKINVTNNTVEKENDPEENKIVENKELPKNDSVNEKQLEKKTENENNEIKKESTLKEEHKIVNNSNNKNTKKPYKNKYSSNSKNIKYYKNKRKNYNNNK